MFEKNESHLQQDLFGIESRLPKSKQKKLQNSKEMFFYKEIFCKINEADFSPLFSTEASRPNAAANVLVASCILKEHHGWTINELLDRIDFDLLTRTALGMTNFEETPFCHATYFNFQNRIFNHFAKTGENLIDRVFDKMTVSQLAALKIKTDIQRMDSFQAMSNIRTYSRVQLLIEVLLRLHRSLDEADQLRFRDLLSPYLRQTSSHYVYDLKRADMSHELEKLAAAYHTIYSALKDRLCDRVVFQVFARVYTEHFTVVEDKIQVKDPKEIESGSLQSPDDLDATFRLKHGEKYHGQVVNVTETAHPDNQLNLITDVTVSANNTDDSTLLAERIDPLLKKTPDLNELHTDGAFGSATTDAIMEEKGINHIQTAVRGRAARVDIRIEETGQEQHRVSCPQQQVLSEKTKTRFKAVFDSAVCAQCPHAEGCQTIQQNDGRVFYFDEAMVRQSHRAHAIEGLPLERQRLRPNVEATVKEFSKGFNHKGKLRVRGWFKTMLFSFFRSMAINFGRIYRHLLKNFAKRPFFGKSMAYHILLNRMKNSFRNFFRSLRIKIQEFQRTIEFWNEKSLHPILSY